MTNMDLDRCGSWQTAISARADGEDMGVTERLLDAHLAGCASCRTFAAAIEGSRRRLVVREAHDMPDLSRRVSKLTAVADRASRWGVVRALLFVVAAEVIVLSAPALFDGDNHDGRHLGAFSVAYGVALAVVAVRPARARTVLPVSIVLAAALSITAVIDLARGVVPLTDEATHIPELISVLLVWMLTVPKPGRDHRAAGDDRSSVTPALRVVRDGDADGSDRHAV
jgi:predicted anti-sigma-YlaC factor YlaD